MSAKLLASSAISLPHVPDSATSEMASDAAVTMETISAVFLSSSD
jgi:hypothetical protein